MANPIKIYKTLEEAYNALLKGFRSIKNRDPDIVENQMLKAEAQGKIKSQGDNISIFPEDKPEGIMSQAPGMIKTGEVVEAVFKPGMDKRGKMVKKSPSQRQADLDRPFVTEEEMSAFTLEENARKLNKAKGFIDKLGAKTTKQKLFIADLVEDAGTGIFQDVDMGAIVRSKMFDDLIEQGIDDDLLTNIMYSGTKSDDFATTLAKIKSNARDEGVDIDETVDFYERVFDEVARVKKAMGGRIGYAEGNDDPKKLIKKIPKVGKTVSGIESLKSAISKIMNKFGEDSITTADKVDQPEKTTQQLISEFEARNKPDAITMESREILDVPPVPSGFKLSKEKLMTKFPEIDENFADDIMDMDKDTQGRIIKMLENRRLDPEAYDRLLAEYGDTLEFQAEFDKVTRRKNNNQGGLNYLMGL